MQGPTGALDGGKESATESVGTRRPAGSSARRSCSVCGERLSSYNPADTCFVHTVGVPWKGPNNRP